MPAQVRSVVAPIGAPQQKTVFTSDERAEIIGLLSSDAIGYGARAGRLLRSKPGSRLKLSPRARLAYLHLCQFMGVDKKRPADHVSVPLQTLARWLDCSPRTAQRAVRELTRSGPLPLLFEQPGRKGRATEFTFVLNPFTSATKQHELARETKARRHHHVIKAQLAATEAHKAGVIDETELARRLRESGRRRTWNTPTRPMVQIAGGT